MNSPILRFVATTCLFIHLSVSAFGQQAAPRARINAPVDEGRLVTLTGNTHPLARARYDAGAVADTTSVSRMFLLLSRSPEQEADLQTLLEEQQTPGSPHYRQWLTPAEFGEKFGPAPADVQAVTSWLTAQGFQVAKISAAKTVIEFSGNAGQLRQAFHTQMHQYSVGGTTHFANATDPQIPAALAPVVRGIASLNNFGRKSFSHQFGVFYRDGTTGEVQPQFTVSNNSGTSYYAIGPADFATIYSTTSLQQAGVDGRGQTIAVAGRTNINLQDVADFRNLFGLGSGNTSVVIDRPDPGIVQNDEFEALLDVEWANASAPGANVVLVSSSDTSTTSGVDIAALHVIENNLAGVLSVSYGLCEAGLGTAENQFIQGLWQQAAAQGITVVVSTGDNGSAGCDDFNNDFEASRGLAVSGVASTPFNVAAGGTDFNDATTATQYWSTTNAAGSLLSAKSYIPEMTWNNSCGGSATAGNLNVCPMLPSSGTPPSGLNIVAASGGASSCSSSTGSGSSRVCQGTPKPAWQTGTGVPNDGVRDVPDISLFSAFGSNSKSFYVVCDAAAITSGAPSCQLNGGSIYFLGAGGTSAAAPNFAGMMALAGQKAGTRLGNVNYLLYSLAAQPGSSCASNSPHAAGCIFNDVTRGNISVPCAAATPNCSVTSGNSTGVLVNSNQAPAFAAGTGYDLATGLGSVNGANLVNAIASAVAGFKPTTTALTLNGATSQVVAKHGDPISVAVNVTPTAATGSVSLLGTSAGIDGASLSGGLANWSSTRFPGGNYSVTAHYPGDGTRGASDSSGIPVSITPEASQTFVNLVTFDLNGHLQSFTANSASYGSPYVLRMDVTDAAGAISSTQGVSSTCANRTASCPTGTLSLTANGIPLDAGSFPLNGAGIAEDARIQLTPGSYSIAANYPGDPSYAASSTNTTFNIAKAPVTVISGINTGAPYTYGSPVAVYGNIATTSNGVAPTGTVAFFDNGTQLPGYGVYYQSYGFNPNGSPPYAWLTGTANYEFTPVGTHTLTAQYSGDGNYASGSAAPLTFAVIQATPGVTVGSSVNPSTPILPVTIVVSVGGTASVPTGGVTFTDNGIQLSGPVTYGAYGFTNLTASMPYTFTQLGTHNIVANYSGDSNYTPASSSPYALTVASKLATYMSGLSTQLNPALVNYPTQLSTTVFAQSYFGVPAVTGSITFYDNGTPIPDTGNVAYSTNGPSLSATLTYTFNTTGTHTITAQYNGDPIYATAQEPQPLVLPVNSTLTSFVGSLTAGTGAPVAVNQDTLLVANIYGVYGGPNIGGGTVTFLDGGAPLTGTVSTASTFGTVQAWMNYTFTTTGTHNITAQYSGDANYSASQSTQPLALTVEGLLWVKLDNNQGIFSSSGGSTRVYIYVDNNTPTDSSMTLTCKPDSAVATCLLAAPTGTVPAHSSFFTWLDLTVPAHTGSLQAPPGLWTRTSGILLCGVFMGLGLLNRRRKQLLVIPVLLLVAALLSCGGGGGGGNTGGGNVFTPPPVSKPQIYNFTITVTDGVNTSSQVYVATVQ